MTIDSAAAVGAAQDLSMRIRPLLAGKEPEIQGAVLADLVSLWVAGWHEDLRDDAFERWIELVRRLTPESVKEIDRMQKAAKE